MTSAGYLSPSAWNSLIAPRIEEMIREASVLPGVGYLVNKTANGTTLSISKPAPGSPVAAGPFQILTQTTAGGALQWGVAYGSRLYASLKPGDKVSITGLLSASPASTDPGWVNVQTSAADFLWLEIGLSSSLSLTSASIKSIGSSGTFSPSLNAWSTGAYAEQDGSGNQTLRVLIGWSTVVSGSPVITQGLSSHLLLQNVIIDGVSSRFPFPWDGSYIST